MEQTSICGEQERAAVILAGGEGSRLRSLTRRIMGRDVPKQFCPVLGKETLLEQTLRRASLSVEARAISVVVTRSHEPFYSPLARDIPARNLVVQPQNRGTAPAILYSLVRLAELAPRAQVAIFPSDHFVNDDREFMRHVDMAFAAVRSRPELTVLLGIQPESPETGYGWIEPASAVRDTSAFMVAPLLGKAAARAGRGTARPRLPVEQLCDGGAAIDAFGSLHGRAAQSVPLLQEDSADLRHDLRGQSC